MEGLEACEVMYSEAFNATKTSRIDPEYFNPTAIKALETIKGNAVLGDLVLDGYRVVYEATQTIDRDEGERQGLPYFLQSADIKTPFINFESMECVQESDWLRYPKGRIKPGELLVEVKGKAEKIAIVPDNFPKKTLVTGTCFKLTTKNNVDHYFLAAYLTCSYGQALKDRLKSNLLVAYIAKDDLYGLPVPDVSNKLKKLIHQCFINCFDRHNQAISGLQKAESKLLQLLNLENWQPPEALTYIRSSRDAFAAERFDAEYFAPHVTALMQLLGRDGLSLADVAPARHARFTPTATGDFHYIEIGDLETDGTARANKLVVPSSVG